MRWFRSNVRLGAWCALLTLALQFSLTFTHVHAPAIGRTSPIAALAAGLTSDAVAADAAALPDSQPAKPLKQRHSTTDDFCAICSLIQLAASSLTAASPSLPIPLVATPIRIAIGRERTFAASPPPLFQARAPPIA
jgi:hypothetical protein